MGRKSLAEIRKQEILDAFEVCIATVGFHASSTRKIADEAGVKQPVIAHYFGSKAALVEALVARVETYYLTRLAIALDTGPENLRLENALEFLFGPEVLGPEGSKFPLGALIAAARNNEGLRSRMVSMYDRFLRVCEEELKRAVPKAKDRAVRETAYGTLSLVIGNDILLTTGGAFINRDLARACARALIQNLKSGV